MTKAFEYRAFYRDEALAVVRIDFVSQAVCLGEIDNWMAYRWVDLGDPDLRMPVMFGKAGSRGQGAGSEEGDLFGKGGW